MFYLLMMVIGCFVLMFFVKFIKLRIWEIVWELFGDNLLIGFVSLIEYVVLLFWKKKKKVNCVYFYFWYIIY